MLAFRDISAQTKIAGLPLWTYTSQVTTPLTKGLIISEKSAQLVLYNVDETFFCLHMRLIIKRAFRKKLNL